MRDVARAAGVPVSAVPLVLANKPGVSAARRARVQSVVNELGYERPLVSSRHARRHRLGLVIEGRDVPIFTDYYYGELLVGIQAEAKRLGLSVWLHTFDPGAESIEEVARAARAEVDGLIIVSGGDMTDERIARLERTGLPTVLVDNFLIGHDVHAIVPDNFGAGYIATSHLIALGHRRIGLIPGCRAYRKFVHRLNGYVDALAAAELPLDTSLVPPYSDRDERWGEGQMLQLLAMPPPERPTAVVATTDRAAARALMVLHREGVQVPHEISVVGIGDTDEATSTIPLLTTVSMPRRETGILGVRRLVDLLAGTAPPPHKTVLYAHLVERESAAPPRAANGTARALGQVLSAGRPAPRRKPDC
jgi:DNA-binding LacI/PurR family transcriptional regulator